MSGIRTLKALDTVYNGYKFRSRLEARWAVFFDCLGIKYEYEPEGFELSDGTWYLPDFKLTQSYAYGYYNLWVEVKPKNISYDPKFSQFKLDIRDQLDEAIMLSGDPFECNDYSPCAVCGLPARFKLVDNLQYEFNCTACELEIDVGLEEKTMYYCESLGGYVQDGAPIFFIYTPYINNNLKTTIRIEDTSLYEDAIKTAKIKARSARFDSDYVFKSFGFFDRSF